MRELLSCLTLFIRVPIAICILITAIGVPTAVGFMYVDVVYHLFNILRTPWDYFIMIPATALTFPFIAIFIVIWVQMMIYFFSIVLDPEDPIL